MGCSREDLLRWSRELLGPSVPGFTSDRIDLSAFGVPVVIAVRDAPGRTLGLIRFRELEVTFEHGADEAAAAHAWIAAFDRHTQRGGG